MFPPLNSLTKDWCFLVLKSYFDGANKADSTQYDTLTLATVLGTDDEWNPFNRDWEEMRKKHLAPPIHITDVVARQNEFEGWTESRVDSLLRDCARIAEKHFLRMTLDDVPGVWGLYCGTVSINLKDFVAHARTNPEALQDANQGCIRHAVTHTLEWAFKHAACQHVHCIFDRGEPFYGYLLHMTESKTALKDIELFSRIAVKTEADSSLFAPLQLADMFAWVESHKNDPWKPEWKERILRLPYYRQWYDKTNVHDVNHESQRAWEKWNIPKRAATK